MLQIACFEQVIHPLTGKKRMFSVCKTGKGVMYRIPMPGHPIVDGIGEGKPENQVRSH
jgi:hypothetical protein